MNELTEEVVTKIFQLYSENKTNDEITRITGYSEYHIRISLKQRGISRLKGNKLPLATERKCRICNLTKPIDSFPNHKICPSGKDYRCKTCSNEKRNDRRMRRMYGISQEQYDEMFKQQNGLCKICNKPEQTIDPRNKQLRRLSVDHSHTGIKKVRGLLCQKCNVSLGNLNDDITLFEKAIEYLKEYA